MAEATQPEANSAPSTEAIGSFTTTRDRPPWDYYEQLRALGDVVWDETMQMWVITAYDLIKQVALNDHVTWREPFVLDPDYPPFGMTADEWVQYAGAGSDRALPLLDGDEYDTAHRWWFRVFSPKVLARWGETLIEPIANELIDRFAANGSAELKADYAERVSPRVMAAVLGLPWDDESWFTQFIALRDRWLSTLQFQTGGNPPREAIEIGLGAMREIRALVAPSVEAKRAGGEDDFISLVWRDGAEVFNDEDFGVIDVVSTTINAFSAGSGTTGSAVGNALYMVLADPELQGRVLGAGEGAVQNLAEEALRLYSPAEYRPRRALKDTELGGVTIKAGQWVLTVNAAGSRDPSHYRCPYDVDIERPAPRDHFGFFMGPRTCPGQSLARFQLQRILRVALERLPDLRTDSEAPPPAYCGALIREWKPLHARFTPS